MTASTLGAEPAYPPVTTFKTHLGLTKRELLAAMAMQGILSDATAPDEHSHVARVAVGYADALLKALGE